MKIIVITFLMFCSSIAYSQSSWQSSFMGQPNHLTTVCFPSQQTGYIFGTEIMYKTTNSGTNWTSNLIPYKCIEAYFINNSTGYVLAQSSLQGDTTVVIKTTNGSQSWTNYRLLKTDRFTKVEFINSNTGYVFTRHFDFYFKTTNGGLSWINTVISPHNRMVDWDVYNTTIWGTRTFSFSVNVYRSTTGGINFSLIGGIWGGSGEYYDAYEIEMINEQTGYLAYSKGSSKVRPNRLGKTTNGGENWTQVHSGLIRNIHFLNEQTGYGLDSEYEEIERTTNGGVNWTTTDVQARVNDIAFINAQTGFVVADYGVLLTTTNGGGTISIHNISTEVPERFSLEQNYPNPFNPETTIEFSIPKTTVVTLLVYDMGGREIATLLNERLSAGTYTYDFNAKDLASGIYMYRLETEYISETKRMVLIK